MKVGESCSQSWGLGGTRTHWEVVQAKGGSHGSPNRPREEIRQPREQLWSHMVPERARRGHQGLVVPGGGLSTRHRGHLAPVLGGAYSPDEPEKSMETSVKGLLV